MRLGNLRHAVKSEINVGHLTQVHGGPKTLLCVTAGNPAQLQSAILCRLVIAKHAHELFIPSSRSAELQNRDWQLSSISDDDHHLIIPSFSGICDL
jgi:hypothetical protein